MFVFWFYFFVISNFSHNTYDYFFSGIVDQFKDLFGDFKQSFDNNVTPYFGLIICVWGEWIHYVFSKRCLLVCVCVCVCFFFNLFVKNIYYALSCKTKMGKNNGPFTTALLNRRELT
jgi:hypothetical protein